MNKAINKYSKFEECFGTTDSIFNEFGADVRFMCDSIKRYVYIPPKDKDAVNCILLVAHLDTVQVPNLGTYEKLTNSYVDGAGFDDRSGLCGICNLYQSLDNVGILLTDNEESGGSTSTYAMDELEEEVDKYNLLVELDREGADYVTYDYANGRICEIMEQMGVNEGVGSFSDICNMDDLGIMAINLGIGCFYSHAKQSVQSIDGLNRAINIVKRLAAIVLEEFFPDSGVHHKIGFSSGGWKGTNYGSGSACGFNDYDYLYDDDELENKTDRAIKEIKDVENEIHYTDKNGVHRNIFGEIIDDDDDDDDDDGCDVYGFDNYGFDINGFDSEGYDYEGYNKFGFNEKGYNYEGYDKFGFDEKGFSQNDNKPILPFDGGLFDKGDLRELA